MSDLAPYSEAIATLGKVLLASIPPPEVQIMRAKARSPLLAGIIDWRLKKLRMKQINKLAKEVERSGYSSLDYIKFVNDRPDATPMDSLTAYLIDVKLNKK